MAIGQAGANLSVACKTTGELYKKYGKATWFWVQEEPLNMGAASFLQMNLKIIQLWYDQPAAKCINSNRI